MFAERRGYEACLGTDGEGPREELEGTSRAIGPRARHRCRICRPDRVQIDARPASAWKAPAKGIQPVSIALLLLLCASPPLSLQSFKNAEPKPARRSPAGA